MLIDFTEGTVTALYLEYPKALVLRIADHPDYEGFISLGGDYKTPKLTPVKDDSFDAFRVYDLWVRTVHLDHTSTSTDIWLYSAYTDGEITDRCSYYMRLSREGANGWWCDTEAVNPQERSPHFGTQPFRLPLPSYDPNWTPTPEPAVERIPDWERLGGDD